MTVFFGKSVKPLPQAINLIEHISRTTTHTLRTTALELGYIYVLEYKNLGILNGNMDHHRSIKKY